MTIAIERLLILAGILAVWWAAAFHYGPTVVPDPPATLAAGRRLAADGTLLAALGDSALVYLSGYLAAAAAAVPLGLAMGAAGRLGKAFEPYVYALAATPRVAFVPLVIVLLGLGVEAKVFIVFLGAIMPILVNTYAGVLAADDELVEMARSTGAGKLRIFLHIVLPGALPFVVAGLRLGATIGLINTVVAELYTAVQGLGGLLALYGNTFRMAEYFAIVITLAFAGVAVTEGLRLVEQRFARWRTR
ncbi:ABC transporter permease [Propylenella binzhouense]|uniref:ABC transporter permease n=1 Tax=Propylenella binzhouense TaxID=2555902 RepID=UPI0031B6103E